MSERMKKLINKPEALAWELLEGLAAAYGDKLKMTGNHILVRRTPKDKGKVQILFAQGSGHEPGYQGFVGYGMHDIEVAGPIFACAGPLAWGPAVVAFLKGSLPVLALFVGLIAVFIGIADIKDRIEAKKEEAEEAKEAAAKAGEKKE